MKHPATLLSVIPCAASRLTIESKWTTCTQEVREVEKLSVEWLRRGRALSLHSPHLAVLLRQIIERAGTPPPTSSVRPSGPRLFACAIQSAMYREPELTIMRRFQPEEYSFWIGNIVPTSTAEKLRMLEVTSTAQRLAHLKLLLKVRLAPPFCTHECVTTPCGMLARVGRILGLCAACMHTTWHRRRFGGHVIPCQPLLPALCQMQRNLLSLKLTRRAVHRLGLKELATVLSMRVQAGAKQAGAKHRLKALAKPLMVPAAVGRREEETNKAPEIDSVPQPLSSASGTCV